MSNRQLKSLIRLLRTQGVVSFRHEGLELVIDPNFRPIEAPPKHVPGQLASEVNRASPGFLGMTPDEVLLWSTNNKEA